MQKAVLILFLMFLVIGISVNAPLIIADRNGDGSGNNNGNDSNLITDNSGSSDDDDESEGNEEIDRIRIREERRVIDEEGREVKIEREIRIKDGEVEIKTRLKVEGNGANFSVVDSEGERHRVRVTSERLRTLIMEILHANNITDFSLDEIEHKNIPRVVFKINSDHPGRFLGIFKLAVKAETQIDTETGEVLDVNTPWWIFLVVGEGVPDPDEIIGNESLENEIIATDEELEEEFGDIEIDEELEINVETQNGSSEVKVELEFDTATLNTNEVISEILSKLTLNSEEIDSLLEIGESDEPLEDEEKLEVEIETEEGFTDIEFEWKFIVNSDNRKEVVNAIITRLFSLTTEDINNVLVLETEDEEDDEDENEDEGEDDETGNETNSS